VQTPAVATVSRTEHVLLGAFWGVPMLATVAFLVWFDLPVLAAGLLVVEVVVLALVLVARRRPSG